MGRKLRDIAVISASLIFFSFIFAGIAFGQGENLRVYVRMHPEAPNSKEGRFWEGSEVRVELQLFDANENPQSTNAAGIVQPPTKLIDWEKSNFKLFYVWDNLDSQTRIEYREPFAPVEGEHLLFAYAVNSEDKFVTPVTKFFLQYRTAPPTPVTQHVYVSGETVKYGTEGLGAIEEKKGQITEVATSTSKIVEQKLTPTLVENAMNFIQKLVSGRTNLWIVLLVIGLALLVAVKVLFREKK